MMAMTGVVGGGGGGALTSANVTPNPCIGTTDGTGYTISEHAFANAVGGVAPFTYAWTYASGYTGFGFTDPTQREVWWSSTGADHREGVYMVTITDALGHTALALVTIIMN